MLIKKMLRDMGRHKSQFISIFLMAFLAIFIYAGVGAEWRGLQKSADDFYAETNLADIWIYGQGFTDEQLDAVRSVDGVSSAERRLDISAMSTLKSSPQIALRFIGTDKDGNEISKPLLAEGASFDPQDQNGIWLSKRFADARQLKPGDDFELLLNGTKINKTIRGLIYVPEQVFLAESETLTPDFSAYGTAYLSAEAFPVPAMLTYSTLLIRTDTASNPKPDPAELENKISDALDGKYSVYLEQADHPSVSMFHNEVMQHKMMGDIFPIAFLLIALLTMLTTMTRLVTGQRVQIGTLKALGFKKRAIITHYISYGFFLALLGAACGLILGPLTLPYLFYPSMSGFYTLPVWKPAYAPAFFSVSALLVLLCALVTFLSCRKLLSETPADTLRPKAPKVFRHGFIEKTALWRLTGFNAQWNFRDAGRNRLRSLMAILGVLGCTALIVCALTMNQSMGELKVWQYEDINKFESKIILEETVTRKQADAVLEQVQGEAIMEGTVELRAVREEGSEKRSGKVSGTFRVTDRTTLISPTDVDLKPVTLPEDGISITQKMADQLQIKKGDDIEWHLYGTEGWIKGKIVQIYREPTSQGITISRSFLESNDLQFRPTAILSAKAVSADALPDGVETVLSTTDTMAGWDDMTEAMYVMVYLLIAAAAVLAIVVLYNLGLLSFTEMEREMATLKVMGMKSGKLRRLLLTQNLWFSAVGFLLGLPGGIWLTILIVNFSGDAFDFPVSLRLPVLLISFVFTFGLSLLVNLMFSRKIRRLNMVESLKGVE